MKKKVIFFQAHPDDLEFYCTHLLQFLCKERKDNYEIKIASITRGEFGVPKHGFDRIKGEKLGKIRTKELLRVESLRGITPEQIHFFNIVDGYVKFDKSTIEVIKNYLNKEKPDIVFACEPINTYYRHPDHMNTGKCVFYILHNMLINFKNPKLYYYTSLNANFYWPFKKDQIEFAFKMLDFHRSQLFMLKYTQGLYKFIARIYGRGVKGFKYAEGYRRVFYGKDVDNNTKLKFWQRLLLIINVKIWPEKVTIHEININELN